eukprot:4811080-Pleurochrysis_carterae.AAC.3
MLRRLVLLQRSEGRLTAKRGQLGARIAVRALGEVVELHVAVQGRLARVDGQHMLAVGAIRQLHVDEPVEASGAEQSGVDKVGPVGGGHDENPPQRRDAVHLAQQL